VTFANRLFTAFLLASVAVFICRAIDRSEQRSLIPSIVGSVYSAFLVRVTRGGSHLARIQKSPDILISILLHLSPGILMIVAAKQATVTYTMRQRLAFGEFAMTLMVAASLGSSSYRCFFGMALPLSVTKYIWYGQYFENREAVYLGLLCSGVAAAASFSFLFFEQQARGRFDALWDAQQYRSECAEIEASARVVVGEMFSASCFIMANGCIVSSTAALDDLLNGGVPLKPHQLLDDFVDDQRRLIEFLCGASKSARAPFKLNVTLRPTSGSGFEASIFCMQMHNGVIFIGVQVENSTEGHHISDEITMLVEDAEASDQHAKNFQEWRTEEGVWMERTFALFNICSALLFGCFSLRPILQPLHLAVFGSLFAGLCLICIRRRRHCDASLVFILQWTANVVNGSLFQELVILSAYWSLSLASAELALQMDTMRHGFYVCFHVVLNMSLAPVTNLSPRLFVLVILVQLHRWCRFHQTVNYFKPAVWVFGGLISLLSYASYHSAEESRKQIYCAMQREQQACNVMRQQFESFERMLDCLFDTTCWTNLHTLVHKEVSQRFAHFFTNMAGIPLEMVGFTVKDKLKFHQLLEDAKRAEGKRASIDFIHVALPGLSTSCNCTAKVFAVLQGTRWKASSSHVSASSGEGSCTSSQTAEKIIFVGFQMSRIESADDRLKTDISSDWHNGLLDVEVTPWDSVTQVAERAEAERIELNQRKTAKRRTTKVASG